MTDIPKGGKRRVEDLAMIWRRGQKGQGNDVEFVASARPGMGTRSEILSVESFESEGF